MDSHSSNPLGKFNTADRPAKVLDKNLYLVLSKQIPWDDLVNMYNKRNPPKATLNPRVLIGAVIIKHTLNLDDRETIAKITENMYLKYFLGYGSYNKQPPFDASLFVDIRKRLGQELIADMIQKIHGFSLERTVVKKEKSRKDDDEPPPGTDGIGT